MTHEPPDGEQDGQTPEIRGLAEEIEPEQADDRRDGHPAETVGAARDRGRLVGDLQTHGRDRQREHQLREAPRAQDDGTRCDAEHPGGDGGGEKEHDRLVKPELGGEDAGGVGAEAEERAVAERDDAGVAEDQVQRQREQDVGQDARAEEEVLRQHEEDGQCGDPGQPLRPASSRIGAVPRRPLHARAPNRPAGRHSKSAMVAA